MIDQKIKEYLEQKINPREPFIAEMEQYAKAHNIPIMDLLGMETLLQLLRLHKPKRILEIGTAIGYSAIRMALALPNATIYSIERDETRYEQAIANVKKFDLADRIHLIFGDALTEVKQLEKQAAFDVLFIDAAKGQYKRFFELYTPLLNDTGVVFSDNVLFRGYVANDEIENKRLKNIAKKINDYNLWLYNLPNFVTTILPVGDGLAISIKK